MYFKDTHLALNMKTKHIFFMRQKYKYKSKNNFPTNSVRKLLQLVTSFSALSNFLDPRRKKWLSYHYKYVVKHKQIKTLQIQNHLQPWMQTMCF